MSQALSDVIAVADHARLMYKLSCVVMNLISDPLYSKGDAATDLAEIVDEMGREMPEMPPRKEIAAAVESTEAVIAERRSDCRD